MVEPRSHPGPHRYEVHEVLDGDPPVDLGLRCETADFGDAVEFAFEFLERRDPLRQGAVSALEIVKVEGAERTTVWTYSHAQANGASGDLMRVWGYDVTRSWTGPYRTPVRQRPPVRRSA